MRSRSVSRDSSLRLKIGEPHVPQKHRSTPLAIRKVRKAASPAVSLKSFAERSETAWNAEPVPFRQREQWQ